MEKIEEALDILEDWLRTDRHLSLTRKGNKYRPDELLWDDNRHQFTELNYLPDIWGIGYCGEAMCLRFRLPSAKRVVIRPYLYLSRGPAKQQACRLNKHFKTDKFSAVQITRGYKRFMPTYSIVSAEANGTLDVPFRPAYRLRKRTRKNGT